MCLDSPVTVPSQSERSTETATRKTISGQAIKIITSLSSTLYTYISKGIHLLMFIELLEIPALFLTGSRRI